MHYFVALLVFVAINALPLSLVLVIHAKNNNFCRELANMHQMEELKAFFAFAESLPTSATLYTQMRTPNTVFGVFGCIWARIWACQIWSSGVSLKRSCKMQFSRVDLNSQKLWPNIIFGWFPQCNYNVKLKKVGGFCLLVYKFETFCGVFIHHLAALVQR